jgi:hypothetical protein
MEREIAELKDEVRELKAIVIKMSDNFEKLSRSCSRMDAHIDFVEGAYDTLKFPLNYIKSRVEYLTGTHDSKSLT